jgi:spore coat protein A
MVVNGVAWPTHDVEPDLYRLRLLNGCNSRFLNLALIVTDSPDANLIDTEIPFYQIGAEQGLLPAVVEVSTGRKAVLPNGAVEITAAAEALLMGLAERADVIVDFRDLPPGTVVRMINTGPDEPFGGFPEEQEPGGVADPSTTGQVMQFVVGEDIEQDVTEAFSNPWDLVLSLPDSADPAAQPLEQGTVRDLALLEEESAVICVEIDVVTGEITPVDGTPGACPDGSEPFAPKAAVLGTQGPSGGMVQLWADPITENVSLGATETWELWNWSADAHPIHLHLVKFKVFERDCFDTTVCPSGVGGRRDPEPTEAGWKDTVIAYPGEVTRVNATFDIAGLYVWHCHIVEHEDNEMMRPYCVGNGPGCNVVP